MTFKRTVGSGIADPLDLGGIDIEGHLPQRHGASTLPDTGLKVSAFAVWLSAERNHQDHRMSRPGRRAVREDE